MRQSGKLKKMESILDFQVAKEKIIKTDHVLHMYIDLKQKNIELKSALKESHKKYKQSIDDIAVLKLESGNKLHQFEEQKKELEKLHFAHTELEVENDHLKQDFSRMVNELNIQQLKNVSISKELVELKDFMKGEFLATKEKKKKCRKKTETKFIVGRAKKGVDISLNETCESSDDAMEIEISEQGKTRKMKLIGAPEVNNDELGNVMQNNIITHLKAEIEQLSAWNNTLKDQLKLTHEAKANLNEEWEEKVKKMKAEWLEMEQKFQCEINELKDILERYKKEKIATQLNEKILESKIENELEHVPVPEPKCGLPSVSECEQSDNESIFGNVSDIFKEMRMNCLLSPMPSSEEDRASIKKTSSTDELKSSISQNKLSPTVIPKIDSNVTKKLSEYNRDDKYQQLRMMKTRRLKNCLAIKKAKQLVWLKKSHTLLNSKKSIQSVADVQNTSEQKPVLNINIKNEADVPESENNFMNGIVTLLANLVSQKLKIPRCRKKFSKSLIVDDSRNVLAVNKMLLEKAKQVNITNCEKVNILHDLKVIQQKNIEFDNLSLSGNTAEEDVISPDPMSSTSYGCLSERSAIDIEIPILDSCYGSQTSNPPSIEMFNQDSSKDNVPDTKPFIARQHQMPSIVSEESNVETPKSPCAPFDENLPTTASSLEAEDHSDKIEVYEVLENCNINQIDTEDISFQHVEIKSTVEDDPDEQNDEIEDDDEIIKSIGVVKEEGENVIKMLDIVPIEEINELEQGDMLIQNCVIKYCLKNVETFTDLQGDTENSFNDDENILPSFIDFQEEENITSQGNIDESNENEMKIVNIAPSEETNELEQEDKPIQNYIMEPSLRKIERNTDNSINDSKNIHWSFIDFQEKENVTSEGTEDGSNKNVIKILNIAPVKEINELQQGDQQIQNCVIKYRLKNVEGFTEIMRETENSFNKFENNIHSSSDIQEKGNNITPNKTTDRSNENAIKMEDINEIEKEDEQIQNCVIKYHLKNDEDFTQIERDTEKSFNNDENILPSSIDTQKQAIIITQKRSRKGPNENAIKIEGMKQLEQEDKQIQNCVIKYQLKNVEDFTQIGKGTENSFGYSENILPSSIDTQKQAIIITQRRTRNDPNENVIKIEGMKQLEQEDKQIQNCVIKYQLKNVEDFTQIGKGTENSFGNSENILPSSIDTQKQAIITQKGTGSGPNENAMKIEGINQLEQEDKQIQNCVIKYQLKNVEAFTEVEGDTETSFNNGGHFLRSLNGVSGENINLQSDAVVELDPLLVAPQIERIPTKNVSSNKVNDCENNIETNKYTKDLQDYKLEAENECRHTLTASRLSNKTENNDEEIPSIRSNEQMWYEYGNSAFIEMRLSKCFDVADESVFSSDDEFTPKSNRMMQGMKRCSGENFPDVKKIVKIECNNGIETNDVVEQTYGIFDEYPIENEYVKTHIENDSNSKQKTNIDHQFMNIIPDGSTLKPSDISYMSVNDYPDTPTLIKNAQARNKNVNVLKIKEHNYFQVKQESEDTKTESITISSSKIHAKDTKDISTNTGCFDLRNLNDTSQNLENSNLVSNWCVNTYNKKSCTFSTNLNVPQSENESCCKINVDNKLELSKGQVNTNFKKDLSNESTSDSGVEPESSSKRIKRCSRGERAPVRKLRNVRSRKCFKKINDDESEGEKLDTPIKTVRDQISAHEAKLSLKESQNIGEELFGSCSESSDEEMIDLKQLQTNIACKNKISDCVDKQINKIDKSGDNVKKKPQSETKKGELMKKSIKIYKMKNFLANRTTDTMLTEGYTKNPLVLNNSENKQQIIPLRRSGRISSGINDDRCLKQPDEKVRKKRQKPNESREMGENNECSLPEGTSLPCEKMKRSTVKQISVDRTNSGTSTCNEKEESDKPQKKIISEECSKKKFQNTISESFECPTSNDSCSKSDVNINEHSSTAPHLKEERINILQEIIIRPSSLTVKPENVSIKPCLQRRTSGFKRPNNSRIIPACPQSPTPPSDEECVPNEAPIIIPLEKPPRLEITKAASVFRKLITYSNEEKVVEEAARFFTNQEVDHIANLILEQVAQDTEKADTKFSPAPLMTDTQRVMLGFMLKLEQMNVDNLISAYLRCSELRLLHATSLQEVESITRLQVAICKSHKYIARMRRMCCDAFYFLGDLAIPFFFIVLTSWIEVLPLQEDSANFPMVKVLVQLVNLKNRALPGYNLLPLKNLLGKYYKYPTEPIKSEIFFQEIFSDYLKNPVRPYDYPILLYCRNHMAKWVCERINCVLKPMLDNIKNDNFKATVIILIVNIVSQFDKKLDGAHVEPIREWFRSKIQEVDVSEIVKKSLVLGLRKTYSTKKKPEKNISTDDIKTK